MSDKHNRLAVPAAVVAGCLALFLVIVALASNRDATDANPAIGFPIVLVILAVLVAITAVVWRAVSRRKSSRR